MTDGNTGSVGPTATIAPIASEDDMSKLATLFQRAANAVVQASTLPEQLNTLAKQVDDYKTQIDREIAHSTALSDTINELRQARDNALSQSSLYLADLNTLKAQNEGLSSAKLSAEQTIVQLNDELERARKDSDEHLKAYLDTSDELAKAKKKLDHFKAMLVEDDPKPEPNPEFSVKASTAQTTNITDHGGNPPSAMQVTPEPTNDWGQSYHTSPTAPTQDPHPVQASAEPSPPLTETPKPETQDHWEPGYDWDYNLKVYVRQPL